MQSGCFNSVDRTGASSRCGRHAYQKDNQAQQVHQPRIVPEAHSWVLPLIPENSWLLDWTPMISWILLLPQLNPSFRDVVIVPRQGGVASRLASETSPSPAKENQPSPICWPKRPKLAWVGEPHGLCWNDLKHFPVLEHSTGHNTPGRFFSSSFFFKVLKVDYLKGSSMCTFWEKQDIHFCIRCFSDFEHWERFCFPWMNYRSTLWGRGRFKDYKEINFSDCCGGAPLGLRFQW